MSWLLNIASAAEISAALPGPYDVSATGPVGFIANFYYFALGLGGLLAFGSIVYAGIKWTTSQGNPGTISDAKDQIVQALWGLVLLGGAFVILNTINPELTILQIPKLGEIEVATSTGTGGMDDPNAGLCTKEHFGACAIGGGSITQSCEKQEDETYKCVTRDEAIWACFDEYSIMRACYRVGSNASPEGRAQKASCDTFCVNAGYNENGCVPSIKPKSGCKLGV